MKYARLDIVFTIVFLILIKEHESDIIFIILSFSNVILEH